MSRFTSTLDVRQLSTDPEDWMLLGFLAYEAGRKGSGNWIVAPFGYRSNGVSMPRFFWWLASPSGRFFRAGIVHDLLYWLIKIGMPHVHAPTRAAADREFYLACRACGGGVVICWLLWAGVRIGGGRYLRNAAKPTGVTVDQAPVPA